MDLMSSGGGGAALDHRDMDGPDHCIPSTPRKTTTFIPDLNCHEEIADFEDILDVPVALLTPFPEKSASGKIVSPPLAPVTPCNDSSEGLGGKKRGGEEFGELHTVEVGEGMGLCSDQSAKSVASDSCENERNEDEEMEEIDLNKMPKKKAVRRKKHRPKVVFEDKPVRSSKSVTPKRARSSKSVTSKRASARKKKGSDSLDTPDKCEESKGKLIPKNVHVRKEKAFSAVDTPSIEVGRNKAKLAVEKTYVRKKKVLSSLDTPDKTEKTKLLEKTYVRRKKASNASTITDLCGASAVGEIVEGFPLKKRRSVRRCLSFSVEDEATNGLTTRFSTEFAAKSPAGIAFDLNHSLNQGLDEYLRLSVDPTSSNLSSKSGMEHLEAPDRSRKTVNSIGMQSDSDGCINAILTDDAIEKTGTKREHDLVDDIQHCCINESSRDVCFVNGDKEVKKTSFWQETGNLIQYFPIVHKKRRTERGKTWGSNRAVANNFRYHSFADVQRSTRLNGLRQSELILSIDRIPRVTRKRSKIPNRARKLTTLSILDDCSHLLWYPQKTKESLYESENKSYESQTCLEALAADTRFKITTKRPRNKVNYNLVRSLSFNSAKKCETTLSNFSVLGQHFVIGLSASTAGNWKNLKTESNFGRSFYSSFQSQAVVSYMGPVENIVNKMKHLKIIEDTEDEVESIEKMHNALIPYGGGSMMVPYRNLFDQIKKRRPRAKVVLDPETNRVWNMLMGKKHNNEADDLDMDKEKKWEEERKVFRGRAELFIARMHLILGDRRFSKWKGSVVDSVVGVFLTQNVSDHLSSSAFMSLAAKYPLRSRGHSREANDEKMKRKQEDGSILDSGNSINSQEKKVVPEENDPGSEIHDLENEAAEVRISLGRDDKSGTDCSEGRDQEIDIDSTQDGEDEQVTAFGNIILEETVDKMSMEDLISSQNSVITSENFSENLIQTTHVAEDLILKNKCIGLDCPATIVELILNRESNKTDESYKNGDWVPTPENIGAVDKEKNCINIEMENRFSDKMDGLGNDLEIMKTFDNKILEENSFPSTSGQLTEVEPHALGSKLCVQTSICSETEIFLEKHYSCQDNHSNEKFEDSLGESIFHECPQVEDEHTVKVHPKGMNSDFKAENSHRVLCREQAKYMRSHNELEEAREPVKITESNLKNEACSSEYIHSERLEGISEARYVNNVYEKKTKNYWESLRKEASVNERSSDELDSLDWEAVRNADVNEIARVIRERGMNNVLAQRIKDFLNRLVKDHGSIDLEWLKNIPPEEVKDYLLSIRGLGIKSVECVRLLTLQHLAFPVDTNVGRICVRLGWVPLQPLPESLQLHLLELYPMIEHIQKYLWPRLCHLDQKTLYELHYQMITFGKVFCTKTKPNCNACPMRGDCKHFASAFASARLALPGPEEKQIAISRNPFTFENDRKPGFTSILQPLLEGSQLTRGSVRNNCEPIIEEPTTPEHEFIESLKSDIEDAFFEDPEEIPTIKLSLDEFKNNLISYMQENNVQVEDDDMSKALVAVTADVASIPMPKLKNISRLRTEHQVYELPDSHPLLEGIDQRVPDDPCPYLLAIWTPGETAQSTEPPQSCCNSQGSAKLCDNKTCFACNSIREAQAQTVRGTLLIPCRTAMRGSFPLNGTYFQVNEVFADHSSSHMPIDVPREWIWNLPRRTVFFGSSISTIFRGLTTEGIQHCFWRGFVCVRGFDRSSRAPKPLYARLHFPPSKAVNKNKKTPE